MPTYIIGVGSSHPKACKYLEQAAQEFEKHPATKLIAQSKRYPNPAFGGQTFFPFLNAAFKIQSALHPDALWFLIHKIENKFGRFRIYKNSPRTLDLDILESSLGSIKTSYLTIPHPEFEKRPFALKPADDIGRLWAEII